MIEDLAGHWEGEGKTEADVQVRGTLDLEEIVGGKGLALAFRTFDADDAILSRQRGILTARRLAYLEDTVGELKILDRRDGDGRYVYGIGEPADDGSYRVEVSFSVVAPGEMEFRVSTGLPGELFAARFDAHLRRTDG